MQEMDNIKVIKRDGSTEKFLPWKIQRVMMAAGLDADESYGAIHQITDWIKNLNTDTVNSVQISEEVFRVLKEIDEYAANMFAWYQQTKKDDGKN